MSLGAEAAAPLSTPVSRLGRVKAGTVGEGAAPSLSVGSDTWTVDEEGVSHGFSVAGFFRPSERVLPAVSGPPALCRAFPKSPLQFLPSKHAAGICTNGDPSL